MSTRDSLLLCALLVVTAACEQAPRNEERGFLYFGSGRYLGKLDLSDGSSAIAANAGDVNIIEVSAGRGNTVLLSVTAPSGYLEVDRILRVDVTTGQRASLYSGKMARYLPGPNTVISPDEILYEIRDDEMARIFRYNGRTEVQKELPQLAAKCELDAAVWVEPADRLACQARGSTDILLAAIEARDFDTIPLPDGKRFRPLAYAADQDALILSETWNTWLAGRPRVAVWMYYLQEKRSERLFKDQEISKSAVYSRF